MEVFVVVGYDIASLDFVLCVCDSRKLAEKEQKEAQKGPRFAYVCIHSVNMISSTDKAVGGCCGQKENTGEVSECDCKCDATSVCQVLPEGGGSDSECACRKAEKK